MTSATGPEQWLVTPPKRHALSSMLALAERTITVNDLVSETPLYTVDPHEDAHLAHRRLQRLNLDVAPLAEQPITRFVRRGALADRGRSVLDTAEPIDTSVLVAANLPLAGALQALLERPFLFVLDRNSVTAIITRADVQLPQVGLYAFGMITATEAALDELIARYTNNEWERLLTEDRRDRIQTVYQERVKHNAEVDLLRCANLDDRLTMVGKLAEVRGALGYASATKLKNGTESIKVIRNCLAHGDSVLSAVADPRTAIAAIDQIRRLAETAWGLVANDPSQWDRFAASSITVELEPGHELLLAGLEAVSWPAQKLGKQAWVITAANPMGRTTPATTNARNHAALIVDLEDAGLSSWPAKGSSGEWEEHGRIVVADGTQPVLDLARAYAQQAVFRLDAEHLDVIDCADGARRASRSRRMLGAQGPSGPPPLDR